MNDELYEEYADEDDGVEYYAIRPNKTLIKKQIAAIFAMAEEICLLSPSHIKELQLPESISQALLDAAKMPANSARKRLLKYITQQLRTIDTDEVQERLARFKNKSVHAVREHHQAERWRDVLLSADGNQQLTFFIGEFPQADSQYLRQLQRNAQKEAKESKPPKSARLLYRYLKQVISGEEADNLDVVENDESAE